MNVTTNSALDAVRSYINDTACIDAALVEARAAAAEFGLLSPDSATGEFLSFLAARSFAGSSESREPRESRESQPAAVVMSPACGVIGLHLFAGSPISDGHVTCIDPEVQHQQLARQAFTSIGLPATSFRFVPSAPLDGVARLAPDSYDIIVADVEPELLSASVDAALPALRRGGTLVLLDSLLDGALGDAARTDRQTEAARAADTHLRELNEAGTTATARLPLGAGMTIITRR